MGKTIRANENNRGGGGGDIEDADVKERLSAAEILKINLEDEEIYRLIFKQQYPTPRTFKVKKNVGPTLADRQLAILKASAAAVDEEKVYLEKTEIEIVYNHLSSLRQLHAEVKVNVPSAKARKSDTSRLYVHVKGPSQDSVNYVVRELRKVIINDKSTNEAKGQTAVAPYIIERESGQDDAESYRKQLKKYTKALKEIQEMKLKGNDFSSLNEDQRAKLAKEDEFKRNIEEVKAKLEPLDRQ